jgi:hypothetical protein
MRFMLSQDKKGFEAKDVAGTLNLPIIETKRELKILLATTFVKEINYTVEIEKRGGKIEKKKVSGYTLNQNFIYLSNFKNLLLEKEELAPRELYEHFKKLGSIELFIVTGIFQGNISREIDLVIAGKKLKKDKIEKKISEIESVLGGEIKYAVYESEELVYRHMMYDRFIRQTLNNEHIAVVNTLNLK